MILSILICTIESRRDSFEKLFSKLNTQRMAVDYGSDKIEILAICDNKQISVGKKRQALLEMAKGLYVVFIDDDDDIPGNYINKIIDSVTSDSGFPDSVGFKIECNIGGKKETAIASNKYHDWCENKDGFRYCRTPYHKTPILKAIAKAIGFKDMRYAEDYDYSKRLKDSGLIKKEFFIDQVMYYYNYKFENPQTKYGLQG